jgi:hypothetical protein
LLVIARAAHQTGDRDLERAARKLLHEQHGIVLSFRRHTAGGEGTVVDGND